MGLALIFVIMGKYLDVLVVSAALTVHSWPVELDEDVEEP